VEKHRSTVTLKLSAHIVAKGQVNQAARTRVRVDASWRSKEGRVEAGGL
jgi:hypothetical protein